MVPCPSQRGRSGARPPGSVSDMSHRSPRRTLVVLALVVGAVVALRKATADKGGTFDPARPETH